MIITKDMNDFIRLLELHKVKYVLVGGFAVNYYGYVRTTQDIDILILPSTTNARKIMTVLKEFGFGEAGIPKKCFESEGTAIHLGVEPNRIDLLTNLKGVPNSAIFANLKRIKYSHEIGLNMISFKDLLACKKCSDRVKDLADVDELEKTQLKQNKKNATQNKKTKK
jgi:Domain of unknown function (DUF1814).